MNVPDPIFSAGARTFAPGTAALRHGEHARSGKEAHKVAEFSAVAASGRQPSPGLKPGQLWRADDGYLEILHVGSRLIHYKRFQHPDQRIAVTRLIGIDALAIYLRSTEASLAN